MKNYIHLILFFLFFSSNSFAQNELKSKFQVFMSKETEEINTYTQKVLNIVPDSVAINKNAKLKIIFPKFFGDFAWDDMFWILIPPNVRAGYIQAKSKVNGIKGRVIAQNIAIDEFPSTPSSFFDYKFAHENNQVIITINILDTIPVGDTLQIIYGANGSGTFTFNSMIAQTDYFSVLLDNKNNGNYIALKESAKITSKHAVPKNLSVVVASTAKQQQPTLVKLMVSDLGKNIAFNFSGTIQLNCTDASAVFPSLVSLTPADSGAKDVYVVFNQNGVFTVTANVISSPTPINGTITSNPVNVSNDSLNIYWGELHTHGKISRDGFGDDGYLFARNGVGLDFYGAADHSDCNPLDTFGINKLEWELLKSKAKQYSQNGRFVPFLSYENSLDNPSGHYNFIYNFEDSTTNNIPVLAKNDNNFIIQSLWTKLDQLGMQGKVLTIPHHTGKLFGLVGPDLGASQFGGNFENKNYKRNIEIYSGHGLGEYYNPDHKLAYERFGGRSTKYPCFAQDAWALKEKLGVIASTDSHNGTPSQTNIGYTAVLSDTLIRNNIFKSLYNRHSYATTGERMVLKFTMNNAIMGDELTVDKDSFPTIKVEVNGTDLLDYMELLKWDFKNGTYTSNPVHPIFQVINKETPSVATKNYSFAFIDTTLRDSSMYYVRVKQKNLVSNREVWAWSSPIWVNKPTSKSGSAYKTDSLYDFKLNYTHPAIQINWCMKAELNTDYFVVERHNTSDTIFTPIAIVPTAHIAFKDSCYTFLDSFPNDSLLFYRIKAVSYTDGLQYSTTDSIYIPYVVDSVYGLKVKEQKDRISIQWKANEYFAEKFIIEKKQPTTSFNAIATLNPLLPQRNAIYNEADFYPLKDTSFYRIYMALQNGRYKLSNVDTLVFITDSLINIKTIFKNNDSIVTTWKVAHEQSIIKYELQRSQDRHLFLSIYDTLPYGGVFDTTSYRFYDTSALPGWNYYRIVCYLSNGTTKISILDSVKIIINGVRTQKNIDNSTIKLVQNLIDHDKNYADYIVQAEQTIEGTLLLAGVDGKIYYQENSKFLNGKSYGKIPIGGLASGSYYLFLITNDGMIKDNFIIVFHGGCQH